MYNKINSPLISASVVVVGDRGEMSAGDEEYRTGLQSKSLDRGKVSGEEKNAFDVLWMR